MKTLKRIGLFIWLKFLETWYLWVFIFALKLLYKKTGDLAISLAILLFVGLLSWYLKYEILPPLKEWIKENWKEVKRRIP